jgi:hypothetical protein
MLQDGFADCSDRRTCRVHVAPVRDLMKSADLAGWLSGGFRRRRTCREFLMRTAIIVLCSVLLGAPAVAEVTGVSVLSRRVVAGGQSFGYTGAYEKIVARIDFALDPAHPRNKVIADLDLAPRGPDKRVHFSADLYVLQPVDAARGNGALLFEIANRGRKGMLGMFNRAPGANDPTQPADFGDGFLMRDGYTLVWVGWQFDVAAPLLTLNAPRAELKGQPGDVRISFIVNAAAPEASPADLPNYRPADPGDPTAALTVRNRYWEAATPIPRARWTFAAAGDRPRLRLDGGFEPGRLYELSYRSLDASVAGVGLAAIRDAASAFLHREDLPVRGRTAYVFGVSQSGRFLRQFLVDGFNVDERDRRVFHAVWPHIAGAGLGSFNERFAMPGYSSFPATRFPFTDQEQIAADGRRAGILASYRADQMPKVIYTNTPVEYWGQGRAAALTHTTIDGASDLTMADNVRSYLLAGTQHTEGAFPPASGGGQAAGNPTPQRNVMRALLRAMHAWVTSDARPPESRYPRLGDGTLVKVSDVKFPSLPAVPDPRTIEGPGQVVDGRFTALPFLVPQVDTDGNDIAGIRVPEVAVPLATTTGWNFRSERIGNPSTILALAGSYLPLPRTRAEREHRGDPRRSVAERYSSRDDYLRQIRVAADALVKQRYLLAEDIADVVERASRHWDYAAQAPAATP